MFPDNEKINSLLLKLSELENKQAAEDFWNNQKSAQNVTKAYNTLKSLKEKYYRNYYNYCK